MSRQHKRAGQIECQCRPLYPLLPPCRHHHRCQPGTNRSTGRRQELWVRRPALRHQCRHQHPLPLRPAVPVVVVVQGQVCKLMRCCSLLLLPMQLPTCRCRLLLQRHLQPINRLKAEPKRAGGNSPDDGNEATILLMMPLHVRALCNDVHMATPSQNVLDNIFQPFPVA